MTAPPDQTTGLEGFRLPLDFCGSPIVRHSGRFVDVLFAVRHDTQGLVLMWLLLEVVYPHGLQSAFMASSSGFLVWSPEDGTEVPAWAHQAHIGALGLLVREMRIDEEFRDSVESWIRAHRYQGDRATA